MGAQALQLCIALVKMAEDICAGVFTTVEHMKTEWKRRRAINNVPLAGTDAAANAVAKTLAAVKGKFFPWVKPAAVAKEHLAAAAKRAAAKGKSAPKSAPKAAAKSKTAAKSKAKAKAKADAADAADAAVGSDDGSTSSTSSSSDSKDE